MAEQWVWSTEPMENSAVLGLLSEAAAHDLALSGMDLGMSEAMAAMQARARFEGHRAAYPDANQRCVVVADRLVGRVLLDAPSGSWSWQVVDVVVHPSQRHRGLAAWMVGQVVADADAAGARVRLMARRGASIVGLYRELGFLEIGGDELDLLLERLPR